MANVMDMRVESDDMSREHTVKVWAVFDEPVSHGFAEKLVAEAINAYLNGTMRTEAAT